MSVRRWSQVPYRLLLTGVVCFGAAACGSPATPTVASIQPPTTAAPAPATPMTIRIGPGTQDHYSVEAQPASGSCHYRLDGGNVLPDPSCTPGAVNPQVTQATIVTTICLRGWTSSVRPPASVTGPEKLGSARAYGSTASFVTAEYDHLIPLELGGDPNDPANLWFQPNNHPNATSTRNAKDSLENTLKGLVCSGSLTLSAAQRDIATNWVAAAGRYPS